MNPTIEEQIKYCEVRSKELARESEHESIMLAEIAKSLRLMIDFATQLGL